METIEELRAEVERLNRRLQLAESAIDELKDEISSCDSPVHDD